MNGNSSTSKILPRFSLTLPNFNSYTVNYLKSRCHFFRLTIRLANSEEFQNLTEFIIQNSMEELEIEGIEWSYQLTMQRDFEIYMQFHKVMAYVDFKARFSMAVSYLV